MTAVYAVGIREAELYTSQGPVGEWVIAVTYAQTVRRYFENMHRDGMARTAVLRCTVAFECLRKFSKIR